MSILDYKIPVIQGRNDTPTISEAQQNHPNGALATAHFNSLIDFINTEIIPQILFM